MHAQLIAMKMDGFSVFQASSPKWGICGIFGLFLLGFCVYVFLPWVVFFFFFFFPLRAIKICKLLILYYAKLRVTFVHDLAARNLVLLFAAFLTSRRKAHRDLPYTHVRERGCQKQLAAWECVVSHPKTSAVGFFWQKQAFLKSSLINHIKF